MAKPYLFSYHARFPLGVFSYPLTQIGLITPAMTTKSINGPRTPGSSECQQDTIILKWRQSGVSETAMSIFLREVSDRHADEFILMIMDGAGWHKAKALSVPDDVALIFLPSYSPELDPVEHIWDSMREKGFRNEVLNGIEAVEDQLMRSLATLENDTASVTCMTGFPWIVDINVNAR